MPRNHRLGVSRINAPTTIYDHIPHSPPDGQYDTIRYKLLSTPLAAADVSYACVEGLYKASRILSVAQGDELSSMARDLHSIDDYMDLDISADLYREQSEFKIWHTRAILTNIFQVGQLYNMREFYFDYWDSERHTLLQGHLKNGNNPTRSAVAQDPQIYSRYSIIARYSAYRFDIPFDWVASSMMAALEFGWNRMLDRKQRQSDINLSGTQWADQSRRLGLFMTPAVDGQFSLQWFLNAVYSLHGFGRLYGMREMRWLVGGADGVKVIGRLVKFMNGVNAAK